MTGEILTPWREFVVTDTVTEYDDDGNVTAEYEVDVPSREPLIQQALEEAELPDWSLSDTTNQPAEHIADGGLVVVQLTGSQAVFDLVEADNRFLILWSE